MTEADDSDGNLNRDDLIAAEYVLGVLSLEDRQQVERRMSSDGAFAHQIRQWEIHFGSLNDHYHPVPPDASNYEAIEARLFGKNETSARGFIPSLWSSLAFWRGVSALATACAIVASVVFVSSQRPLRTPYVAELSSPNGSLALMVSYDAGSGRIALTPAASTGATQRSLELWLIPADGTPRSLGIFDTQSDADITIPVEMREQVRSGVTLAVSLEPFGGSPTGKPTGPIVASGMTRQL